MPLQSLWWRGSCSWSSAMFPAVLTVLPPVSSRLDSPLSQGRAAGGYTELSVTPRAPLLSHGMGGSVAALLLPFMWVCAWAKLSLGELPGGWAVPRATAKQGSSV